MDYYLNYDNVNEYMCARECVHTNLVNELWK